VMNKKTAQRLNQAFYDAEDEFGDDKSTEFLLTITADREGVDYSDVADALAYCDELEETDDYTLSVTEKSILSNALRKARNTDNNPSTERKRK